MQQKELQKQQFLFVQRQQALRLHLQQHSEPQQMSSLQRRADYENRSLDKDGAGPRRRTTCTVRVNSLHTAEAIETDV